MTHHLTSRAVPGAGDVERVAAAILVLAGLAVHALPVRGAQVIYPSKDGTLADGGMYGTFDGVADDWDWIFNESGYDGALTREIKAILADSLEHRVVFEYNLSAVTVPAPILATLTATVRGAPVFPRPDVEVHAFSYPADLQETPDDFASGPSVFVGSATIPPFETRVCTFDVSAVVDEALLSGADKVAFRFQIDPGTPNDVNQAFIDAVDSDPTSKPSLTVDEAVVPVCNDPAFDVDGDGDVDGGDFGVFATCFNGALPTSPGCECMDIDGDGDVDGGDFGVFGACFNGALPTDPACDDLP